MHNVVYSVLWFFISNAFMHVCWHKRCWLYSHMEEKRSLRISRHISYFLTFFSCSCSQQLSVHYRWPGPEARVAEAVWGAGQDEGGAQHGDQQARCQDAASHVGGLNCHQSWRKLLWWDLHYMYYLVVPYYFRKSVVMSPTDSEQEQGHASPLSKEERWVVKKTPTGWLFL